MLWDLKVSSRGLHLSQVSKGRKFKLIKQYFIPTISQQLMLANVSTPFLTSNSVNQDLECFSI